MHQTNFLFKIRMFLNVIYLLRYYDVNKIILFLMNGQTRNNIFVTVQSEVGLCVLYISRSNTLRLARQRQVILRDVPDTAKSCTAVNSTPPRPTSLCLGLQVELRSVPCTVKSYSVVCNVHAPSRLTSRCAGHRLDVLRGVQVTSK